MNVLLIGSGGREHALAWKLAQSTRLTKLFAAPGNPGIARHAELVAMDVGDHETVIGFCKRQGIGLVVVGPEAPLVAGLADDLRAAGIPVFGPDKAAAELEGSKGFTKDLCARARIPTAGYVRADSAEEGLARLAPFGLPVVIKADGLAAGKGVVIATTREEAEAAVRAADGPLVIEYFVAG
jgi:phosphoribosylamine--glycine ligase